uniref:Uncharacterized protein n=1 Tax=Rhizophora mucronata TaxID=61149 RepID=A0A2P2QCA6_RHIMU
MIMLNFISHLGIKVIFILPLYCFRLCTYLMWDNYLYIITQPIS